MKGELAFWLAIVSVLALTVANLPGADAGEGGVTIINVPPRISRMHFSAEYGITRIYMSVSDDNSWRDIYSVNLTFFNGERKIALITYLQYANRSDLGSMEDLFTQHIGNYLIPDESYAERNRSGMSLEDKTTLNLTFSLKSIKATYVSVVVEDREGTNATVGVEYPLVSSATQLPAMPVPAEDIAFIIATIGTAVSVKLRYGRREDDD